MSKRSKPDADTPRGTPAPRPVLGRLPWITLLLSLVVVLSSTAARLPVWDARTFEAVPEAHLAQSPAYVLLAPLSDALDTLSLISRNQDIALVVGAFALLLAWRAVAAVRGASLKSHGGAALLFLVAVAAAYAAAAVLPRPMAALRTDDASLIIIDFHSHTSASHDGRAGFTPERSRRWHAAAGYDVAYVTDHATVRGAEEATAENPVPAANGTTLLQGIETGWDGEHVGVLGAERSYKGLLTADRANVDTGALRLAGLVRGREPIVVWHHPRHMGRLPAASDSVPVGVRAIEISNGDPSAMDRVRALHDSINAFADRFNLPLTTGTDNHGWGRAAPNWTLMQIDGWRAMAPDQLETAIERSLRSGGYGITRSIERVVARPRTRVALALSVATVPWTMFTVVTAEERVAWLVWLWLAAAVAWWLRRRRTV